MTNDKPIKLHCWADKQEWLAEEYGQDSDEFWSCDESASCILAAGHDGPHVWTPDDEIVVTFKDA